MKLLKRAIWLCCICSTSVSATNIYLKQFNEIDTSLNNLMLDVNCGNLPSISFSGDELENVKLQVNNATLKLYSSENTTPNINITAHITVSKPLAKIDIANHAKVNVDGCALDTNKFSVNLMNKSYAEIHGSTTKLNITATDNAHAKVNIIAENVNVNAYQSSSINMNKPVGVLNLSLATDSLFELSSRVNHVEINMKEQSIATMCNTANSTINGSMEDDSSITLNKAAESAIVTSDNSKITYCYQN
ncbi:MULTISPECIES: DUF2807 domain-containing protein [unclassified Photobacterium]|uniref:GIN domain-containing protein n=1 Tax=unclassified Photobacterium TaxID=2628852 RepID=UPI001EDFD6E6|nr:MULTISPECIES: DUF2807 domain-containing protein [unclassified Photobacterium]MCG3864539.1 DUF2807 domain-containing protein [Photobacterium sp. Ph6]MCG3876053.1 DUF2807 domain-containing protein [Photobacterium sp. Ph5]